MALTPPRFRHPVLDTGSILVIGARVSGGNERPFLVLELNRWTPVFTGVTGRGVFLTARQKGKLTRCDRAHFKFGGRSGRLLEVVAKQLTARQTDKLLCSR